MATSFQALLPNGEWRSVRSGGNIFIRGTSREAARWREILLLGGPLGAGKTVFVKGIAAGLGIDKEDVTSPSFTMVNPYKGRLTLYHIDLYRLDPGASAAHAVDLDELLTNETAVTVIEWAERLGEFRLPDSVWRIGISGDGDDPRTVSISREGQH